MIPKIYMGIEDISMIYQLVLEQNSKFRAQSQTQGIYFERSFTFPSKHTNLASANITGQEMEWRIRENKYGSYQIINGQIITQDGEIITCETVPKNYLESFREGIIESFDLEKKQKKYLTDSNRIKEIK